MNVHGHKHIITGQSRSTRKHLNRTCRHCLRYGQDLKHAAWSSITLLRKLSIKYFFQTQEFSQKNLSCAYCYAGSILQMLMSCHAATGHTSRYPRFWAMIWPNMFSKHNDPNCKGTNTTCHSWHNFRLFTWY